MVAILASGSAQKLYSVDVDQHMYNNYGELEPFVAKDYIVRTTDENTLTPDRLGIPWDCAIGILMYGIHADIAETFSELKQVIATTLDMEEDWDGPMEGSPSMMALFQSPTQDISLIVAHGSYVDFTPGFAAFLATLETRGVSWIPVDDDNDPIGCLEGLVRYGAADNAKMAKEILVETADKRKDINWRDCLPHTANILVRD